MYKVLALVDGRRTLYVGLTRLETQEMWDGRRKTVSMSELPSRLGGSVEVVVTFFGETEEDCHVQLATSLALPDYRPLNGGVLVYAPPVGR